MDRRRRATTPLLIDADLAVVVIASPGWGAAPGGRRGGPACRGTHRVPCARWSRWDRLRRTHASPRTRRVDRLGTIDTNADRVDPEGSPVTVTSSWVPVASGPSENGLSPTSTIVGASTRNSRVPVRTTVVPSGPLDGVTTRDGGHEDEGGDLGPHEREGALVEPDRRRRHPGPVGRRLHARATGPRLRP